MEGLKWSPDWAFLGNWDRETVKLDFDNMKLAQVKVLCRRASRRWKLQGFRIFRSSPKHYHAVFSRKMLSWERNLQVTAWVAEMSNNEKVKDYALMQAIQRASTLRVSPKEEKPSYKMRNT